MWPLWILLAACDTACNTDRCWKTKQVTEKSEYFNVFGGGCTKQNCGFYVHVTCCVVCTGWTTWVGTPGAGGLESDRLSLEWTEPSRDSKREIRGEKVQMIRKISTERPASSSTSSVLTAYCFQTVITATIKHPATKDFVFIWLITGRRMCSSVQLDCQPLYLAYRRTALDS